MKYQEARILLLEGQCRYIRRVAWKEIDPNAALHCIYDDGIRTMVAVAACNSPKLGLFSATFNGSLEDHEADDWEVVE